jgi:hypothetical protein
MGVTDKTYPLVGIFSSAFFTSTGFYIRHLRLKRQLVMLLSVEIGWEHFEFLAEKWARVLSNIKSYSPYMTELRYKI